MTTYVYFVRHGESFSNVDPHFDNPNDVLTDAGLRQARSVASRLGDVQIDSIYTSDILRARQTAVEIGTVIGVEPRICDLFRERRGSFSGNSKYRYNETFHELNVRLTLAEKFLVNFTGKNLIIVSHAAILKALAAHLILGNLVTEEVIHIYDEGFKLCNGSISTFMLDIEKSKWSILTWNDHSHLAK